MLTPFLLGFLGSFSHCTGMCSGIALLLGRSRGKGSGYLLLLHLGRITTYTGLGLAAGGFGYLLVAMSDPHPMPMAETVGLPGLALFQGFLALGAAILALYMAVAYLGRAPSPELLLGWVTAWWGCTMRRMTRTGSAASAFRDVGSGDRFPWFVRLAALLTPYGLGLLWGVLPCGLVLMALLLAGVTGSAWQGGVTMLLFGLGTAPLALGISLAPRMRWVQGWSGPWVRSATAALILIFGVQMALRGLAVWGWLPHWQMGGVALW